MISLATTFSRGLYGTHSWLSQHIFGSHPSNISIIYTKLPPSKTLFITLCSVSSAGAWRRCRRETKIRQTNSIMCECDTISHHNLICSNKSSVDRRLHFKRHRATLIKENIFFRRTPPLPATCVCIVDTYIQGAHVAVICWLWKLTLMLKNTDMKSTSTRGRI